MKQLIPRRFERRRFLGDLIVRPLPGGSRFEANAINLNQGGVALFSSRSLAVGQSVELLFAKGLARDLPHEAKSGKVAYVSVQTEGNIIGIAFAQPLSADEMRALETKLGTRVRA
jgi:PilZ domain